MVRIFARLAVIIALVATCGLAQESRPTSKPTSQPDSRPAKKLTPKKWLDELATPIKLSRKGNWAEYGGSITMKSQTSLKAVANNPDSFKDKTLLLRGRILSICVKKGCWIRMQDGGEEIFVKFKDYAFFAPRHLSGHDVLLEGTVTYSIVREAERRHMAEDAGMSPEEIAKITGDENELRMMAHAMRIIEPRNKTSLKMTFTVGEFDAKNSSHSVDEVLAAKPSFADQDLNIRGQLVLASKTGFIVESKGKRLVMQFSNGLTIQDNVLTLLKKSKSSILAQGHGRLLESKKGLIFVIDSCAFTLSR